MKKSDKKNLTNKVLKQLYSFYDTNGFKVVKGRAIFKRDDQLVFLGASSTHIDSLTIRPRFRIENKIIGDVLTAIFPGQIGTKITLAREQSVEMLRELDVEDFASNYIITHNDGSKSYYYNIEKNTVLKPIVADHINFMEKVGLPFFDRLNSIEGISDYINCKLLDGDREYFRLNNQQEALKKFFDKREVLSGVVSAYLTNNSEIEELLERYEILFEGNNYILDDVMKINNYFTREA